VLLILARLNLKALAIGMLSILLLSFLLGVAAVIIFPRPLVEHQQAISNISVLFLFLIGGIIINVVSGCLTARIAKRFPITNALALAGC
jgi:hypothetical protein